MRDEFHHLFDELPEDQVAPMLALIRENLPAAERAPGDWPLPDFVGTLASGRGDLAERSEEILRSELGEDHP